MFNREGQIVWLTEERCFGIIVGPLDAFFTLIRWIKNGLEHEEFVENNEFEIFDDGGEDFLIEHDD